MAIRYPNILQSYDYSLSGERSFCLASTAHQENAIVNEVSSISHLAPLGMLTQK